MKIKYLFIIFLVITLSCKKDTNLRESIFIDDPESPGLPIYSEWGYNAFGAYYDREVFISTDNKVPLKIIVTNGTTTFNFVGQKGNYGSEMSMKFYFTNFLPSTYDDLLQLNDSTISLSASTNNVNIYMNGTLVNSTLLNGSIKFDKAQLLYVDTKKTEVILSGHFECQVLINNEPIAISDGRFDLSVNQSNFFNY